MGKDGFISLPLGMSSFCIRFERVRLLAIRRNGPTKNFAPPRFPLAHIVHSTLTNNHSNVTRKKTKELAS